MSSKRMHRFEFDRNKKANPHLMQSADYHIYNMVAHQDPYAVPGGPDTQALIIEEACGLQRRVRNPEIQKACQEPYLQDDCTSYVSSYVSGSRGGYGGGSARSGSRSGYNGPPYPESSSCFRPPSRAGSDAGSSYRGGPGNPPARGGYDGGSSYRGSQRSEGRRSARSADRSSRASDSYYSAQGAKPFSPGCSERPRSTDNRGSQRSARGSDIRGTETERSSVFSGSQKRSEYGSRARSSDGRSRGSGSRYSQTEWRR